jgi:hypothetical protein
MKLKALLHPALALKCRKPTNKNHAGCNKTKKKSDEVIDKEIKSLNFNR